MLDDDACFVSVRFVMICYDFFSVFFFLKNWFGVFCVHMRVVSLTQYFCFDVLEFDNSQAWTILILENLCGCNALITILTPDSLSNWIFAGFNDWWWGITVACTARVFVPNGKWNCTELGWYVSCVGLHIWTEKNEHRSKQYENFAHRTTNESAEKSRKNDWSKFGHLTQLNQEPEKLTF